MIVLAAICCLSIQGTYTDVFSMVFVAGLQGAEQPEPEVLGVLMLAR